MNLNILIRRHLFSGEGFSALFPHCHKQCSWNISQASDWILLCWMNNEIDSVSVDMLFTELIQL